MQNVSRLKATWHVAFFFSNILRADSGRASHLVLQLRKRLQEMLQVEALDGPDWVKSNKARADDSFYR